MFPLLLRAALLIGQSAFPPASRVAMSNAADLELEQAARHYRIQTYNAYRLDRDELIRHRDAWNEAHSRWRAAGGRADDRDALIAWLDAAAEAVGTRRQAPALPDFGSRLSQRLTDSTSNASRPEPLPPQVTYHIPSHATPPTRPTIRLSLRRSNRSHALPTKKPQADAVTSEPRVNLAELQVRAAGYQVAMRTVNSLLHNEEPLNVRQLGTLLDELEALLTTRSDLLLYHVLTPNDERARLDELLKYPQPTVAQFGSRIAGLRDEVLADADLPANARDALASTLDRFSERLANLPEN